LYINKQTKSQFQYFVEQEIQQKICVEEFKAGKTEKIAVVVEMGTTLTKPRTKL